MITLSLRRNYLNVSTESSSFFILQFYPTVAARGTFEQGTITLAVFVGYAACSHYNAATDKIRHRKLNILLFQRTEAEKQDSVGHCMN